MDRLKSGILGKVRMIGTPLVVLADIFALVAALILALWLRFDNESSITIFHTHLGEHLRSLPLVFIVYLVLLSRFRLYRYAWRFSSLDVLWSVLYANSLGLAAMALIQAVIDGSTLPRSVLAGFWILSIFFIAGIRILLRIISTHPWVRGIEPPTSSDQACSVKRVLIIGAGHLGARVLRGIREDRQINRNVVGFLDDDPNKQGMFISNVEVLGPINAVHEYIEKHAVDEVIVAIPDANGSDIRKHVLDCRKHGIPVKVVLHLRNQLNGRTHLKMGDYSIEDLLRRPPRSTDIDRFGGYAKGKRVLVTGAGGSIGSELCRQIIKLQPAQLILFGHGENSIFQIQQELVRDYPDLAGRIKPAIGCITNQKRVHRLFREFNPEVVFHAAAHKHVPLMELNVLEAAQNNVLGTYNIVDACIRSNVQKMVMISTDKAAEPRSIMGATKWLCEAVVQAGAMRCESTDFITTRFGNVLGSRGSVVPVFKEQIANAGPVTVTHPEMTRYFMTIPEAARLVVQAGGVGHTGDLYLLDMGDPVKIADLARDMIRLSGYEPGVDVKISYTGIRPGEKLHEQLTSSKEEIEKAEWDGLSIVHRPVYFTPRTITGFIEKLIDLIDDGDNAAMRDFFEEYIPGFADEVATSTDNTEPSATIEPRTVLSERDTSLSQRN